MTDAKIKELIFWCHTIGGLPLQRLAQDFELPVSEIEEIVGSGMQATKTYEFNLPLPMQQRRAARNVELYRRTLREVYQ